MSADRELLELAAKAAGMTGYIHEWVDGPSFIVPGEDPVIWNPITDDGDALRLLCQRSMRIVEDHGGAYRAVQFTINPEADDESIHEIEIEWPQTSAATRRAIVRAAAAIGEAMP